MFQLIAIIAQIVAVVLVFSSIILLSSKKPNSFTNVMLLAFVSGFIQNVGYLLELMATDVTSAMNAIKIEYIGGAFMISLLTFFIFKYCNLDLPLTLKYVFIASGMLVVLGVWSYGHNGMYYTSARFISDSILPHIELGHGWLYFTFAFTTISELICCIFMCLVSYLRAKEKNVKRNFAILFFVCTIPLLGYMLAIMGDLQGYDSTPISISLSIFLFGFAIMKNHVFDVANYATESIFDNLSEAVLIINNSNGYEGSNYKAKELFDVLYDLKKGELIKNEKILSLFKEDASGRIEIGKRTYEVHVNPIESNDGEIGKTAILIDITENIKQIETMRELMTAADQANVAKSAFLSNVSHEIRTPINVIMGMSEVLYRDHRRPETDEYVSNIRTASSTLLGLINDILDFSKIEAGKLEIIDEEYDIRKMFEDLITVYRFRCEKKGITFSVNIPDNFPRYLIGDQIRVKQIFNNILSNAVKYTEKGNIKLMVEMRSHNDHEIDMIISVEDTGIGIRREDQTKIFTLFSRVDLKKTNTIEGTGLGLNITRELVSLMKGVIKFKSEYGKGSLFTIVIPQRVSKKHTETVGLLDEKQNEPEVFNTDFTAKNASILIVDDSKTNLIVARELLKKTEVNITTASGGEECIKLCQENHYDIIFLDHRMPGMDGIETFEHIKNDENLCKNTPVIMLTANAIGDARDFYISKNFSDFLAKPITSKELIGMLNTYLPREMIEYKN